MVESRWFRRAGPGIAALGAVGLIASTTLGAPARSWQPDPCPSPARIGAAPSGAWYRLDPVLAGGAITGQRLATGRTGTVTRTLVLDAESFAAGPFAGTILVGTDDGRTSRLSLLDVGAGCAWSVGSSSDVVRGATLAPDGTAIYEHRVDRRTRDDLGIWRRSLDGSGQPLRVLAPVGADARYGPTWATDLVWSTEAQSLAVGSCGELACRFRVLEPATGRVSTIADPSLGDLVGLAAGRLITHGACRGLPCPLRSVGLAIGDHITLTDRAGQAVLATDERGRPVVVFEVDADGRNLRRIAVDGTDGRDLDGDRDGRRLVPGPGRAKGAAELPPMWLLFGPDGRLPVDGSIGSMLRHVLDGRTVPLGEVSR
jgi:hypothetical protein